MWYWASSFAPMSEGAPVSKSHPWNDLGKAITSLKLPV